MVLVGDEKVEEMNVRRNVQRSFPHEEDKRFVAFVSHLGDVSPR